VKICTHFITALFCSATIFSGLTWAVDVPVYSESSTLRLIELPEMAEIADVREKKQTFFNFLLPIVESTNQKVQAQRAWLKLIEYKISNDESLELWQQQFLNELSEYYKVDEDLGTGAFFAEMYRRVDIIPASLVLAQAANESAWGTSRFAVEGNNLFGQWCFTKGCGLVPTGRDSSAKHEVKVFDSVADSVESYFRNLNTHHQYAGLRTMRSEIRYLKQPLSSTDLVWGLEGYSIRGEHYILELIEMINHNSLHEFDQPAFYARQSIQIALD